MTCRQSTEITDLGETQTKNSCILCCERLSSERHWLFSFCFHVFFFTSRSFNIHAQSSACRHLPSLPSFIYLLCFVRFRLFAFSRCGAAISLLCFPSSPRPPLRDPGRFHFPPISSPICFYINSIHPPSKLLSRGGLC